MRLSVDHGDPDFIGAGNFNRYEILFNGAPISRVVECDDVAGYVVQLRRDEQGNYVIDAERDEVERVRTDGVVQIIDKRAV